MAKFQVDDNLLVALVHSSTALYDRCNAHYKDAVVKDQAWTTIAKTLNLPKVVCKSRWTILRQRYSRVKRQLTQASKSFNESRRKPTWKLFENLHFLDDHILPRTSFSESKCKKEETVSDKAAISTTSSEQEDVKPSIMTLDQERNSSAIEPTNSNTNSIAPSVGFRFTNFSIPDVNFRVSSGKSVGSLKYNTPVATVSQSPISPNSNISTSSNMPSSCCKSEKTNRDGGQRADNNKVCFNNKSPIMMRQSDSSFAEFISSELATFKSDFNKDKAKQQIVNIIYKYKHEVTSSAE